MLFSVVLTLLILFMPQMALLLVLFEYGHWALGFLAIFLMVARESETGQEVEERVIEKVKVVTKYVERPAKLTRAEAYEVLGLLPQATREAIKAAHRKLMQRVHPDSGGTTYLASRVNQAKDLLLK